MADLLGTEDREKPREQSPEKLLFDLRLFKAHLYGARA